MKKHIKIITIAALVVALFVGSFFFGESGEMKDSYVTQDSKAEQPIVTEEIKEEAIVKDEVPPAEKPQEETSEMPEAKTEVQITEPEKKETVSLVVECTELLSNLDFLKEEKRSLVPGNGIIFSKNEIEIKENESAFDVLKRELISAGIHIEFTLAPVYNSVYIEGINNIYEFDCGERSGWKYSVNGKYLPIASSEYKVQANDKIVFTYKRIAY